MAKEEESNKNAYVSGVANLELAWEKVHKGIQWCRFIDSFRPWFPSFHDSQGSVRETVTAEINGGVR